MSAFATSRTGLCARWRGLVFILVAFNPACGNETGGALTPDAPNPQDAGDAAAVPTPAEPGVCFGLSTAIRCDAPSFMLIEPGPERLAECIEGAPLDLVWESSLGTVDCRLPDCPLLNPVVAAGAGAFWAVSDVREPGTGALVAFAAQRFGEVGEQVATVVTDVQSQLEGPIVDSIVRSVAVNDAGELLWAAPTSDSSGIELRRYSQAGEQIFALVAVVNASDYPGQAAWLSDGSAIVVYRYRPEPLPDGAAPGSERLFTGIARFDPEGRLLWNQSLLGNALLEDPDLRLAVALGDVDDAGNVIVRIDGTGLMTEDNTRLLKLGPDGNVAWAVELPNSARTFAVSGHPSVHVTTEGVLIAYDDAAVRATGTGPTVRYLETLSADGLSVDRVRIGMEYPPDVLGFDASDRLVLGGPAMTVVDPEALSCTLHPCFETVEWCWRGMTPIALTDEGDWFIGMGDSVGLVRQP